MASKLKNMTPTIVITSYYDVSCVWFVTKDVNL